MPRYKISKTQQKVEPKQQLHPDVSVGVNDSKSSSTYNSSSMPKRFAILFVVVVIVLVLVGVWMGSLISGSKQGGSSGYTAVFLVSGDVYFGKLSWFPKPKLTKAWFLQRGVDKENNPQVALAPFSSVFWGPEGDVYLNPKQILFWAPISATSEVAFAIDNPDSVRQQQQQQQVAPQGQITPAPSLEGNGQ
ncbi:MAG: hypothetical protein NUV53_04370 [Patescibacteria group bacterium]|nr:hypothetical protein [Patescibacteria group bacterium]